MRPKESTACLFTALATAALFAACQGIPLDPIRSTNGSGAGSGGAIDQGSAGATSNSAPGEDCAMAVQIFRGHDCSTVCHTTVTAPAFAGFDMMTPGWETRLVGAATPVTAPQSSLCRALGRVYLNRTLPATGLFLDKLKPNPPCGVQMPMALAPLSVDELDCVQRWANNVVANANLSVADGGSAGTGGSSANDARIDEPSDAADVPSVVDPEAQCLATRGKVDSNLCCNSVGDFPDQCLVGPCGCAPANSHQVRICVCQPGTCYLPGRGCVGSDCTIGQDQTCNDNPFISSLHGTCVAGAGGTRCVCNPPFAVNPNSGRCE